MITNLPIKVYLDGRDNKYVMTSKQMDTLREFKVSVINGSELLSLAQFTKAEIRWLKPDGNQVHNDCTIEGNNVVVSLTQQMLAVPGEAKFEIILRNASGCVTTSTTVIKINANVHDDSNIESTAEYQSLNNALQSVASVDARISQLNATKVDKTAIVHNADVTDTTKVPGMDLIHNMQEQITNQNKNLENHFMSGSVATSFDLDFTNSKNTMHYIFTQYEIIVVARYMGSVSAYKLVTSTIKPLTITVDGYKVHMDSPNGSVWLSMITIVV